MNDDYANDNVDTNNDVDKFTQNTISFNHTARTLSLSLYQENGLLLLLLLFSVVIK